MAQQVLGGIGAAIGYVYGGPTGAQYGWMIGSAIGGAIDPQVIQGPRIADIAQQTAQEGVPRPIIFGLSPPIAGNIIATGQPVIVKRKESQGKGGPKVETESVFRTYAIGVCEGPIHAFVRVWRNGMLVYDVRSDSLLTTEENNLFLEKARFFLGTYEQLPSPDLEILFGLGVTPAHQGTAYMVMADEDLTDMRGAIPQWMFQVGRGFETTMSIVTVANNGSGANLVATSPDGNVWTGQTPASAAHWEDIEYSPEFGRYCAVAPVGSGSRIMTSDDGGITWSLADDPPTGYRAWRRIFRTPSGRLVVGLETLSQNDTDQNIITSDDGGVTWVRRTTNGMEDFKTNQFAFGAGMLLAAGAAGGNMNIMKSVNDGTSWSGFFESTTGSEGAVAIAYKPGLGFVVRGGFGGIFRSSAGETWERLADQGTVPGSDAGAHMIYSERLDLLIHAGPGGIHTSSNGVSWVERSDVVAYKKVIEIESSGLLVAVCSTGTAPRIYTSTDAVTWSAATDPIATVRDWQAVAAASGFSGSDFRWPLAEVVRSLCLRAGLEERMFDVSKL